MKKTIIPVALLAFTLNSCNVPPSENISDTTSESLYQTQDETGTSSESLHAGITKTTQTQRKKSYDTRTRAS